MLPIQAGEKSSTTVRIFEKNDFYYFFEKDAEFAAKLTYGSSTVKFANNPLLFLLSVELLFVLRSPRLWGSLPPSHIVP